MNAQNITSEDIRDFNPEKWEARVEANEIGDDIAMDVLTQMADQKIVQTEEDIGAEGLKEEKKPTIQ